MNKHTKKRIEKMAGIYGQEKITEMLFSVVAHGKLVMDDYIRELGRTLAEIIMYMEREQIAGPDYRPYSPDVQKWASQPGSVFIGREKVKLKYPRLSHLTV